MAQGWEDLDDVPKRLLQFKGFSTHDFIGYVDMRSPRARIEKRKKRLLKWGAKQKRNQTSKSKRAEEPNGEKEKFRS